MTQLHCPYLGHAVELTDERERHIAAEHPELLPEHRDKLAQTPADPDEVRRSNRFVTARMFARWFDDVRGGKHVVVVVVSDPPPAGRSWIITAYVARRLSGGTVEWARS